MMLLCLGFKVYGLGFAVYGLRFTGVSSRLQDFETSGLQEVLIVLLVLIEKKNIDFVSESEQENKEVGVLKKMGGWGKIFLQD